MREIMDDLPGFGIQDNGPDRNSDRYVLTVATMPVAAFAVRAALGPVFWIESKLKQCVQLIGRFQVDRSASSAVASGGTSAWNIFFSAKGRYAVSAVSGFHEYPGPIQELHLQ
jgi:hypothetical protein